MTDSVKQNHNKTQFIFIDIYIGSIWEYFKGEH